MRDLISIIEGATLDEARKKRRKRHRKSRAALSRVYGWPWLGGQSDDCQDGGDSGLSEGYWDEAGSPRRYDSKPAYILSYGDAEWERKQNPENPVWVNPSRNTFFKIIGQYSARGLIYETGEVVIWDTINMFHDDVYDQIDLKSPFVTCQFMPNEVSIKGSEGEPRPFTDDHWLPIIRRALKRYYGEDFNVDEWNWG